MLTDFICLNHLKQASIFRQNVIDCLNSDLISICETHLKENEVKSQPGYKWIGHNRFNLNPNAVRGSGGVGFQIKLSLLQKGDIALLDNTFEDLLWIKLTEKTDPDNGAYFCSCYLPPSGSSRGDTSQQIYNKLTSDVYQY